MLKAVRKRERPIKCVTSIGRSERKPVAMHRQKSKWLSDWKTDIGRDERKLVAVHELS